MWYDAMFTAVEARPDAVQSEKMAAAVQNQISFLGISEVALKKMIRPYFRMEPRSKKIDWFFVRLCWEKEYREAQYIGIEYLKRNQRKLAEIDFIELRYLAVTKSCWKTVDSITVFVGILAFRYPHIKAEMLIWSTAENIWLRRIAIGFQKQYKKQTDEELLRKIICNNLTVQEVVINKAVNLCLRDYSKVNPKWVCDFLVRHKAKLSRLRMKEISKYLL